MSDIRLRIDVRTFISLLKYEPTSSLYIFLAMDLTEEIPLKSYLRMKFVDEFYFPKGGLPDISVFDGAWNRRNFGKIVDQNVESAAVTQNSDNCNLMIIIEENKQTLILLIFPASDASEVSNSTPTPKTDVRAVSFTFISVQHLRLLLFDRAILIVILLQIFLVDDNE